MEWYKHGYDPTEEEINQWLNNLKITKMKGKILEIESTGKSWPGDHGLMYVYSARIQALNDTIFSGVANAKSETVDGLPYKIGDAVEFEHTESNDGFPDKLKITKEGADQFRSGGKQKGNNKSFAMSYAKDLVIGDKILLDDMYKEADKMEAWMNR